MLFIGNKRLLLWSGLSLAGKIRNIFTANTGCWYDYNLLDQEFQNSAGTTPITAVEQPLGKVNDQSGGSNHLTQATAAARPVLSARVNLLTKTEDFVDAVWDKGVNMTLNGLEGTIAGLPASRVTSNVVGNSYLAQSLGVTPNVSYVVRWLTDSGTLGPSYIQLQPSTRQVFATFSEISPGVWEYLYVFTVAPTNENTLWALAPGIDQTATESWRVASPQLELGTTATRYQRVNTATDYDAVGFPLYAKLDGIDDGMSSATGGGGLTGFFFCQVVKPTGGAGTVRTLIGDAGVNTGYKVQIDAADKLSFSVGNGTAFTTVASASSVDGGTTALVTAWQEDRDRVNSLLKSDNLNDAVFSPGIGGGWTATTSTDIVAPNGTTANVTKYVSTGVGDPEIFARQAGSYTAGQRTASLYLFVPVQAGVSEFTFIADWEDSEGNGMPSTNFAQWVRVSGVATLASVRTWLDFSLRANDSAAPTGFTFYAMWAQEEPGATATTYQRVNTAGDFDDKLLNVQIGSGAIASVGSIAAAAGTAAISLGKDNGAATSFFTGNLYPEIYVKNSGLTVAQRATNQAWCRSKAGISV